MCFFFSNSCLTDLSAGRQRAAELGGKFEFAGVVVCRRFNEGFQQNVTSNICFSGCDFLHRLRAFGGQAAFPARLLSSPSFDSVRNMALHCCDSSQMAVAEPHRWSYLQRTPPSAPHRWFSPPPMFQTGGPSLNPSRTSSQDGAGTSQAISRAAWPHLHREAGC